MLGEGATSSAGAGFFLGLGAAVFMVWLWDELKNHKHDGEDK